MDDIELGMENIQLTNNNDYYTVPEIVEQVKIIFGLKLPKNPNEKMKVDKKIKQAIRRGLEGEQNFQPKGSKRKSSYKRAVVYSLINSKCRNYFENLKKDFGEKNANRNAVKSSKQMDIDGYIKEKIALADKQTQDDDSDEKPILLSIKEAKVKIFFQYLFESLIDFDESGYVKDLQDAPDPSDMYPSELEVASAQRLLDLHNYYKGRIDLVTVLNRLCQGTSTDTKPQKSDDAS